MAQTGYTPISLYYTTTAAAVPVNTNLVSGELAINITDGKLYYKDNAGVVKLLASNAASATTFSAGTTGFTPNTATSGAVTLAGTLATTNGGTALTSFTSGGAMYATSTSVLTTGTLPVTAGGTGLTTLTAGYIPFGAGTSAFGNSANLFWSSANNRLGIGTTSPQNQLVVSNSGASGIEISCFLRDGTTSGGSILTYNRTVGVFSPIEISGSYLKFDISDVEKMRLETTGQLFINATSGTGLVTIASSTVYPALKVPNIVETANTVAAAPSATTNFYLASGAVQNYTTNAANNWTLNFAFSAGTSLNTAMAVGDSMSCTLITAQGSTAYYNSAVTIDGVSVTPKWQGGTAPTSGNASALDVYTYVIYKTASATYTVLASQTKFA
jgi:hypothetical protein